MRDADYVMITSYGEQDKKELVAKVSAIYRLEYEAAAVYRTGFWGKVQKMNDRLHAWGAAGNKDKASGKALAMTAAGVLLMLVTKGWVILPAVAAIGVMSRAQVLINKDIDARIKADIENGKLLARYTADKLPACRWDMSPAQATEYFAACALAREFADRAGKVGPGQTVQQPADKPMRAPEQR